MGLNKNINFNKREFSKNNNLENLKNPNRKNKKAFPRWLTLSLFSNCFGDGERNNHLGINFRGVYYCITHSSGNGVLIPKQFLKMKDISSHPEYFKKCTTKPIVLHKTKMKLQEIFIVSAILNQELNKV